MKKNQMFVGYAQAIVAKTMNKWMAIGSVVSYSRAQHTNDSVSSFFDAVTRRRKFYYSEYIYILFFDISIHFLPLLCLIFSLCFSISINKRKKEAEIYLLSRILIGQTKKGKYLWSDQFQLLFPVFIY